MIVVLIIGSELKVQGQPWLPNSSRTIFLQPPISDSVFLDSLLVWPSSVTISSPSGKTYNYNRAYTLRRNHLVWIQPPPQEPVSVSFRVLPYPPFGTFAFIDSSTWVGTPYPQRIIHPLDLEKPPDWFGNQNLSYSGSFARGLSFGNRQNLVLNSAFNLQLSGDLGDDFYLLAAISDENIPLQPAGNTQQINEFDRVFVQITRKNNQLTAGDYELDPNQSYFMRFFKKLQGATFSNTADLKKGKWSNRGSVAIARGQFVRQVLEVAEGNQGPYRLNGQRGEAFIIVLAGTERVYLDGQPLIRGIENDYIINYNQGEITFTANRLITRESRIIVEFEYADQNFLRSLVHLESVYQTAKSRAYIQWFSQQDSRNATLNIDLNENDRRQLALAGDDPEKAVASGISIIDDPPPTRAVYRLADTTTACGRYDSVLVFTSQANETLYTAQFSFVGAGRGHYRLANDNLANEPVYQWVAPDPVTCLPQGDYDPVVELPAPRQQSMLVAGLDWQPREKTVLSLEAATSRVDLNRLSELDQQDDNGIAFSGQLAQSFALPLMGRSGQWDLTAAYEYKQDNFQPLNPYRPQEFLRDWGLADFNGIGQVVPADEHLLRAALKYAIDSVGSLAYGLDLFDRGSSYQGTRQNWQFQLDWKSTSFFGQSNVLRASTATDRRLFRRPQFRLEQKLPLFSGIVAILQYQEEDNQRYQADSLSNTSFAFRNWEAGLSSTDTAQWQWDLAFQQRTDLLPDGSQMSKTLRVRAAKAGFQLRSSRFWQMKGRFQYRSLQVGRIDLTEQTPNQTFLGRLQNNLTIRKGAIRTSTLYELGSGQEPQIDFTFVQVAKGEGQYIWLDSLYNNDGILQPNEMEIAPFPDQADYVRIARLTNSFFSTQNVQLNQSLSIIPRVLWFGEKNNLKALAARFSTQSSYRISRKTTGSEGIKSANPLTLNVADSNLVSLSSAMQHTLFFNRGKPGFEAQLGYTDNRSRIAQTTGFETRQLTSLFLRTRVNLDQLWSVQSLLTRGFRFSESENFTNKTFQLDVLTIEPTISWTPNNQIRGALNARFQVDQDISREGGDRAVSKEVEGSFTYNQSVKTTMRTQLSWIQIDYTGTPSSPVGFAILNGLQPGRNLLWSLQLDQQLGRNLRLSLSYEGRKTGTAAIVHVGRAQLAAVF